MERFDSSFIAAYLESGCRYGRPSPFHPASDLRYWENFVTACAGGYDDNLAEYRADLWIRNLIQIAIDDDAVRCQPGFAEFEARVRSIDNKFREVATVELPPPASKMSWWNLVVPGSGGEELARDLSGEFCIEIQVV